MVTGALIGSYFTGFAIFMWSKWVTFPSLTFVDFVKASVWPLSVVVTSIARTIGKIPSVPEGDEK